MNIRMDARALGKQAAARALHAAGKEAVRRAKANCPVSKGPHGGALRESIGYRVEGNTLRVGSGAKYAPYVELGTRNARAQPFLRPALLQGRAAIARAARDAMRR